MISVLEWVEEDIPRHVFFQRSLSRNVFQGDKSPRYCLTIVMNPPKKTTGFESATETTCREASPWCGGEEAGACTCCGPRLLAGLQKKGRQNVAFKLTPAPCWLPFMPLGSLLIGKTLTVSTTSTTGAEDGVQKAG